MIPGIVLGGLLVFVFISLFVGLPVLPLQQVGLLSLMGLLQLAIPLILFAAGAKYVPAVPAMLICAGGCGIESVLGLAGAMASSRRPAASPAVRSSSPPSSARPCTRIGASA